MPREPFQRNREVQQLLIARLVAVERLHLRHLLNGFLYREREVRSIRNELGQRVRFARREAERAPHILHRRPRFHGAEGDNLPHRILAVLLPDVLNHFAAPLEAEVHVHVRHRDAFGIQKALKEQVKLQRAHIGDARGIRHQRAGRRPASRSHRNPTVARGLDEVGRDEEVAGVPGLRDHSQLVVEPVLHVRRQRIAVPFLRAVGGEPHQILVLRVHAGRQRERRHVILLGELHVHRVRDGQRVREHVFAPREERADLGGRFEVQAVVVLHAVAIVAILAQPDAQQHVVRVVILVLQEVRVIRGNDGQPQLVAQR